MATRKIAEYMGSGELDNIAITENIQFLVTTASEEGMFMRIGANGLISLYRAPDQDVHWIDTDTTEFNVTNLEQEVLSVVIDEEIIGDSNGSFSISGIVSNNRNQIQTLDITVKDDGVITGVGHIELAANESAKPFIFSGVITDTIANGSLITVEFGGSDFLTLNGTSTPTKIEITKAQSAPVVMSVDSLEAFDWNSLPHSDPHIAGQIYIGHRNQIKISQG